jgi:tetratricopeptide (TPR) repeat protein
MGDAVHEDVEGATPTQLSDMRPQIDQPLRVAIPTNAPERVSKASTDAFIQMNTFSAKAMSKMKKDLPDLLAGTLKKEQLDASKASKGGPPGSGGASEAGSKTAISDFKTLAFASKRNGKKDLEAIAYVSLGVIYDNQKEYIKAIENYKLYADLCEEVGDVPGLACALNCLGVDYMLLSSSPDEPGFVGTSPVERTEEMTAYLKQAAACHSKHQEIGPDSGGRFVAGTNFGLCLGMLGDVANSAKQHQDALRIAIKMQTLYGQSIAVGNLGNLALIKNDLGTARTCFEQYLQLVQALLDPEAEVSAWKILANLSTREQNHEVALENLEQASRIALKNQYMNELRRINCLIGEARGNLYFDNHSDNVLASLAVST